MKEDIDWKTAENLILTEGIYIFGGINNLSQATNDLYILTIERDKL
jgi:hypothetical protein